MIIIPLPDLLATQHLGRTLAQCVLETDLVAIFYTGALGVGKTTLTRALVEALPGGDTAEITSPSFTICNIYSTEPELYHFDLYRMQGTLLDEALAEALERMETVSVVEWSERLRRADIPDNSLLLHIEFDAQTNERQVLAEVAGNAAIEAFALLAKAYPSARQAVSTFDSFFLTA
jgi:ATPase, YjeE family